MHFFFFEQENDLFFIYTCGMIIVVWDLAEVLVEVVSILTRGKPIR